MTTLVVAILGPLTTVLVALVGYFGFRRLRQAQTRKTDSESALAGASANKTTAEAWTLLTGGLTARLSALEAENATLRERVAVIPGLEVQVAQIPSLLAAVAHAEGEARACRTELIDLRQRMTASEHREDDPS